MNESRFELFVGLTGNAMKSIQRIKAQKMKKYGLSSAHTNCICHLESAGRSGLTQTELVRREMIDPSQISRVLKELTEKGFVALDGEEGKYRRRYFLTDKGQEIAGEIRGIIEEINRFVSCDIPLEDIESFYRTFGEICSSLNRAVEVYLEETE